MTGKKVKLLRVEVESGKCVVGEQSDESPVRINCVNQANPYWYNSGIYNAPPHLKLTRKIIGIKACVCIFTDNHILFV